jgi:REP element-mobilizing transposase RayT
MARPKRIDLPNTLYFVLGKTDEGENAFPGQNDRKRFLDYLSRAAEIFSYRILAWCLLRDHYYLLVKSANRSNISEFMRRLLTGYTVNFNQRHNREGYIFRGRFKSYVVDPKFILDVSRHIHLAPAKGKRRQNPESYGGSSLQYYVKGGAPEFLCTGDILSKFHGRRDRYARFILKGIKEDTTPQTIRQMFIGTQAFARRMEKKIDELNKYRSPAKTKARKRKERMKKRDEKRAMSILTRVSKYFNCQPLAVKKGLHAHGDIGKARSITVILLRDLLPWTCHQIVMFLGLKQENGIAYYQKRLREEKDLKQAYQELKKDLV